MGNPPFEDHGRAAAAGAPRRQNATLALAHARAESEDKTLSGHLASTPKPLGKMKRPRWTRCHRRVPPPPCGDSRSPERATALRLKRSDDSTRRLPAHGPFGRHGRQLLEGGYGSTRARIHGSPHAKRGNPRSQTGLTSYDTRGSPKYDPRRRRSSRRSDPVERRALPEVVTAREQLQRVVVTGRLPDPAHEHFVPPGSLER